MWTAPLEAYNYNGWKMRDLREKSGWVCDLNFDTRLDKPDWVVIDHHATEIRPEHARLIHSLDKSAGLLCYELCKEYGLGSPELDRLVHLNNVADLFLEDDADFAAANDYANLVKNLPILEFVGLDRWPIGAIVGPPVAGSHGRQAPHRRPAGL